MNKEILDLFYKGEYDKVIVLVKKEIRNSDDADLMYYYFLAENGDYSNMNMSNIRSEVNFNLAIELGNEYQKYSYQAEFNFFRTVGNIIGKYFCYAIRDDFDGFGRAYKEYGIPKLLFDDESIERIIVGLNYFIKKDMKNRSYDLLMLSIVILSLATNNSKISKTTLELQKVLNDKGTILSSYSLVIDEAYVNKLVRLYDNYEKNLVFDQGDFKYLTNKDKTKCALIKVNDLSIKNVIIPPTYSGMPVVAIGEEAFSKCSSLRKVILGENVEVVGEYAFWDCLALNEILPSNKLKSIKKSAFTGCNRLEEFFIPNTVVEIEDGIFTGCNNLKKISIGNGLRVIPKYAFSNRRKLENVTIGNHIEVISSRSFANCTMLTGISIPKSVRVIEDGAFDGCKKLEIIYEGSQVEWKKIKGSDKIELEVYFGE